MIEYIKGNLLEAPERIIVHGCNAKGVMGSGVAKAIRERWPWVYDTYRKVFKDGSLYLGRCYAVPISDSADADGGVRFVVNAVTQENYGRDKNVRYVSYEAVNTCFHQVMILCRQHNITEIAIPKIGAGLGNGDWEVISSIIEKALPDITIRVYEI